MIHLLQAIIMGIVQGLSEFLPISSSAHLVFASNLYKIFNNINPANNSNEEIFLDIMLHLGTLVAVIIFFRKELADIIRGFVDGLKTKNFTDKNFMLGIYIMIGTLITLISAIPLKFFAKNLVYMPEFVGLLLIFTGILLLLGEYCSKNYSHKNDMNFVSSIFIGIAQGLAILPGFSRSGLTITAGMFSGIEREKAARYSFLLSIPIILGASMFYPLLNINYSEFPTYNWVSIFVGTVISGITGYFCIKYFLKFISKFSLNIFGYYCIIAGILTSIFFVIK